MKKTRGNPMVKACGAKARTNNHLPCRRAAMANGRCHLHGGMVPKHNPGPKTEEGRRRQHMSNWKHGMRSKEAIAERKCVSELIRQSKVLLF